MMKKFVEDYSYYYEDNLPDSKRFFYRKGDIVKLENGQRGFNQNHYTDWFLTDEDYIKYLKSLPKEKRLRTVPLYAVRQYAIIIGRYRITKYKYRTFRDYGITLMMLSGNGVGHIRRFYVCTPFVEKHNFPHKKIIPSLKNFEDILLSHTNDSNEGRDELISAMSKKLNKENIWI